MREVRRLCAKVIRRTFAGKSGSILCGLGAARGESERKVGGKGGMGGADEP